jgi:hypothetical protein
MRAPDYITESGEFDPYFFIEAKNIRISFNALTKFLVVLIAYGLYIKAVEFGLLQN